MRKGIVLGLLLGLFGTAPGAKAQEESSKYEVYGGYYYVRFNINANLPGVAPSATYNGYGGGGQFEYNARNWLGVVGDLAGYGATSTANGALVGGAFTYLFGPRVNFRRGRFTPFAQALFGGIRTTDGIGESGPENNFAMTAGGGIDFKVSRHVSVRPVQAEYFMTRLPNGLDNRENNLRIGAGIAVRLGK
ncbi:MAG: outer membrane beta-barrel protein [Candidatus Sulfotelmatobacter sp.]|jgi:opacity protein-like surface antigen